MKITILDKKKENNATCYLCSVELSEYLSSLPDDFSEWEVQRGIVSNTYLDSMIDTVLENRHIPPLVLVTTENVTEQNEIKDFKILDGLQRTFRLRKINGSFNLINKHIDKSKNEIFELSQFKLSRLLTPEIATYNADIKIIRKILLKFHDHVEFKKSYVNLFKNKQWFEIWYKLSIDEQIEKMLMLNAGHVSVSPHHQIELLFQNLLKEIKESQDNIEILLSRELTPTSYSKKRKVGEFLFSHIVSSFISLIEGKATPTNSTLIKKVQDKQIDLSLSYELINKTCTLMVELDKRLECEYKESGLRWMGKEVVLNSIFSAIGEKKRLYETSYIQELELASQKLLDSNVKLNIHKFDEEKNKRDISKINIGKHSRDAVFNAITDLLEGRVNAIKWSKYLGERDE
ncbi:hypothetical protein AB4453_21940 [Vibrio atlanticus]|uniref:hypothetical protein n=1 Tax=Vibrio TaxID=662 RepID=UPI000C83096A|nr:hypothetical protein [Vibrio tasmaniensis]PML44605.1 hypothetical protein BCT76_18945 [Vibrio tasmaniensis]